MYHDIVISLFDGYIDIDTYIIGTHKQILNSSLLII